MPYVIAEPCIDVMDRSCMEECPVDCIYEGERKLYINPAECIDCGACEPACPVSAISQDRRVPPDQRAFVDDNARFFAEPLPGRDEPLGMPGGAAAIGPVGVDTELVASHGAAGGAAGEGAVEATVVPAAGPSAAAPGAGGSGGA